MNLVSSNNKKVFLSKNTQINNTERVNIILSPELYWVRVFDIPVKNVIHARHVLPTLFEDILANVSELSFQVIKLEENKYLCFAYVNKNIYKVIKNSGINLSLVDSIYFAQNECEKFREFTFENKSFIYTPNNILTKVPNVMLSNAIDLKENINNIQLSSHKVDIKLYNNVLTSKQIYSISGVILCFSIITIYKFLDYKTQITKINNQIEIEKKQSNLPSSMLQTNSILNKYKSIESKEKRKREFLEYLLSNSTFKINKINLDKNIVVITFNSIYKVNLEKFLSKKYKIISSKVKALDIELSVKL
ncbi:MAG: hypothetical protein CL624_13105 [Arcobacter sp.]|nr:hypothetical protein [Arcobacter sp.]